MSAAWGAVKYTNIRKERRPGFFPHTVLTLQRVAPQAEEPFTMALDFASTPDPIFPIDKYSLVAIWISTLLYGAPFTLLGKSLPYPFV